MKAIILTVAVALTDLLQVSAFDLARPVWPESFDGLPNVRFAASFEADGRPLVLKATR